MNAIVQQENRAMTAIDPETLILKAVESNVPVESLERLLAMRDKLRAEQAREAFYHALSGFQAECPPIKKTREVKDKSGKVRYSFAPLDDIVRQVGPLLQKNGLSYSIKTELVEGGIKATCEIHHAAGHSEESSFSVPIEKEAFMNEAQKAGSAQSYAKRYAFSNALGIMTTDYDDDGRSVGDAVSLQEVYKKYAAYAQALRDNWESIGVIRAGIATGDIAIAAEAWFELTNEQKESIWLAPSKGGIFTTEERNIIKSNEFRVAHFGEGE